MTKIFTFNESVSRRHVINSIKNMNIKIFFIFLSALGLLLVSDAYGQNSEQKEATDQLSLYFYVDNSPVHFIVVEKSKQQLMVFEQGPSLKLLKTFVCATGENPGKKNIRGDLKTPEGIYFITQIYEDKEVTVFGSRAYHLDYPNVFDKTAGLRGDGIFIHGTNKELTPYSTNGCITLANEDLDELAAYLSIDAVPIIVLENLYEPLLERDMKINKNDSGFKKLLHEQLSFNPETFSTENIEVFSFLKFGSQAIASINYRVYEGRSIEYRYRKKIYLVPAVTKDWRTLYSVKSQLVIPSILAIPKKHHLLEKAAPPENIAGKLDTGTEPVTYVHREKKSWIDKKFDISRHTVQDQSGKYNFPKSPQKTRTSLTTISFSDSPILTKIPLPM
ncbi:MAG: L,D-transpeptidase [Desulforhopalus sp.]